MSRAGSRASLRRRLQLGLVLGMTAVLAGAGVSLHWLLERRLLATLDSGLLESLAVHGPSLAREARGLDVAGPPGRQRPSRRGELTFELRTPDGRSLVRSERLHTELPRLAAELVPVALGQVDPGRVRFADVEHPDLPGRWRALGLVLTGPLPAREGPAVGPPPVGRGGPRGPPFRREAGERSRPGLGPPDEEGQPGDPLELVLLTDARPVHRALDSLAQLLVATWIVAALVTAGLVALLLGQGLAPLVSLQRQLERADPLEGPTRFELPDAPAELEPVVSRLNGLVERMAAALAREQEFSGHAAHELRTPLAGLRATLELALARPREAAAYRQAAERSLALVEELSGLVETLLLLAREGAGQARPCDLAAALHEQLERLDERLRERRIAVALELDEDLQAALDPALLERLLANLLGNAVDHGDEGGSLRVVGRARGESVELTLANPAREAPAEVAERAFDPFWRGDAARGAVGRHAGLGLALCRRLAEQVGGTISARRGAEGWFTIELVLPRAA